MVNRDNINHKQRVKDHFDSLALERSYWIKKSNGFYLEDIKFMKELIPEGSTVLEIGCGNGNLIGSLNPAYGLGIDISPQMILEAKNKYKNINFIEADIESEDGFSKIGRSFEYIIISDTIGYLINIETALEKIHKLCS